MMDDQIDPFREEVMLLRSGRRRGAPRHSAEFVGRGRTLAARLEAADETRAQDGRTLAEDGGDFAARGTQIAGIDAVTAVAILREVWLTP